MSLWKGPKDGESRFLFQERHPGTITASARNALHCLTAALEARLAEESTALPQVPQSSLHQSATG